MPKKLIVNDNSDYVNRWQAFRWFSDADVITLSVGSRKEFIAALNGLIRRNMVFDRVAFRTHGDTGIIWFGDDSVGGWGWTSLADEINFPALFPGPTKIYFDSCDTAVGEPGNLFLTKAGEMLLRAGGGSTSGWASWGLAVPGVIPFIGGHTIHTPNFENLKTFYFKPGGVRFEPVAPPRPMISGMERPMQRTTSATRSSAGNPTAFGLSLNFPDHVFFLDAPSDQYLAGLKADASVNGCSPLISSANRRPVVGPSVRP